MGAELSSRAIPTCHDAATYDPDPYFDNDNDEATKTTATSATIMTMSTS
jgi:hypothetical protein